MGEPPRVRTQFTCVNSIWSGQPLPKNEPYRQEAKKKRATNLLNLTESTKITLIHYIRFPRVHSVLKYYKEPSKSFFNSENN
jgi:hypothetical protein